MKRDYSISVAMATYNGEKFIKEQLDSILKQLNQDDEVVISDDGSTDKTKTIINSYKDKRIKLINGPKKGVKQNFANAISECGGKYIFLSDQDDIWLDGKVKKVLETFEKEKCTCVVHDCEAFDSETGKIVIESFFEFRGSKPGKLKNIVKNSYIGCCMAFDSSLKEKILPIPNDIEMHDQWIGIISEIEGKSVFLKTKLLKYRRHNSNVSQLKRGSIAEMFTKRNRLANKLKERKRKW